MIHSEFLRRVASAGLVLLAVLVAVPAGAQEPAQPGDHVVRRGDTLWDLAGHFLGNPFLWPMIYEANRSVVENPHWIYPGERLRIPGAPGEPAAATGAAAGEAAAAGAAEAGAGAGAPANSPPVQAAAISGAAASGATMTLDLRRPVIEAAEYYSSPWLGSDVQGAVVGRVARLADQPSAAGDQIPPVLHPHDRIHIGELHGPASAAGDTVMIARVGREVPGYGQVVEPLALVQVDTVGGGMMTGRLVSQFGEARVGDEVMRLPRLPALPEGRAEPVANGPEGKLLQFLMDRQIYGTGEYGFVDVGEGLRPGDELSVFIPARRLGADAAELVPATEVGRALVIRVAERTATVRLTGVFDTALRAGLPVRLVARMP